MKKKNMLTRPLAAMLALVMALTLAPVAAATAEAVAAVCPTCLLSNYCTMTVLKVATCHETGVERYVCTNPVCKSEGKAQLRETNVDPANHDAVYTDNGDGTHSGICDYTVSHGAGLRIDRETHKYNTNGMCEKCGVYNYSQVKMDLADRTVPVALNDADARLTAGDIRLTLGSADITNDYNLTYSWYYQGNQVSTSAECSLPASVYGREGIYYYTLHVLAVPRGTLSRQPVSESCTITVRVEELVTASAIITTDDTMLRLGEEDYWSAESISSQIYEAVKTFCGRNADPMYVTFDISSKSGTNVGDLDVTNTNTPYYFSYERHYSNLDDVRFLSRGVSGDYSISFTAHDNAQKSYAGVLTITVQQYVGNMDVLYVTSKNEPVSLSAEDFEAFWAKTNPRGVLDYISFDETPRSVDGTLYIDYTSQVLTGDRVRTSDQFYVEPGRNEYGIDSVVFLPGVTQSGYITLGFTAYGSRGTGYSSRKQGTMYIFFNTDSRSADISLTAAATGTALDPAAFQKAYQSATGGTGASFYIQLLDVPASGALYSGRTSTKQGVRLTASAIEGRPFAYNGDRNETISSLTYVPGTAASESIRYVASSAQGKPLYAGKITFTSAGVTPTTPSTSGYLVKYNSTAAGVAFQAASFASLPASTEPRLGSICFTPPAVTVGSLYYDRTASSSGTLISGDNDWFSVSTASASSPGIKTVDRITFVPATGVQGVVTIPFTTINAVGGRATGSVQITVSPNAVTNPGTTTVPGTTTQPAKTFPDVPKTEWYYTYVTDLTTSGVLSGYEDGTFRPSEGVTLGQALKMIMTAAGYPEQAATGTHWASGYLTRAKADNLLPVGLDEGLDRRVSRYAIAEIAAKAMKLPAAAVITSPFSDMPATNASAPYVMALYNIRILTGSLDEATNTMVFQGEAGIRRKDISAIIWRMQNYVRTGNANTVAGTTVAG